MRTCSLCFNLATKIAIAALIAIGAFILFLPGVVSAASLALTPASGSYSVGSTFTVAIVASTDVALNAVSGVLSFPAHTLEVVSLAKNPSVLSLWVQEPNFSNSQGTVQFEGVAPNPGYTGVLGKVLGVTFRVKAEGVSDLTFSAGSILANDGEGTEILASKGSANFTIVPSVTITPISASSDTDTVRVDERQLPVVTSGTHKNGEWSNQTEGTFAFEYPSSVTALRLLVDEYPMTIPVVTYAPAIPSRTITDLAPGISYLHVQYKTTNGWGEILHYKLAIDTQSPDAFIITEVTPGTFSFVANDVLSGVVRYEVTVDTGAVVTVDSTTPTYTPPTQSAGAHILTVRAIDTAGNATVAVYPFVSIEPVPTHLVVDESDYSDVLEPSSVSFGAKVVAGLSLAVSTVALIGLLGFLIYALWRASGVQKRSLVRAVGMATKTADQLFAQLDIICARDIEMLQKVSVKRKLTREEAKILKHLEQKKAVIEQYLSREILCKIADTN